MGQEFGSFVFYLSNLFRLIGMMVFGIGAGWFTLHAFRQADWRLQIAAFLGLFGLVVALMVYSSPGAVGAFTLTAGASLIIWGLRSNTTKNSD